MKNVMLANAYAGESPAGWLMSEKLDGVRAIWDGAQLLTRNGNRIHAPAWFTAALPALALDGELWLGRGKFQATVSTVRKKTANDAEWRNVRFMVFDAPAVAGGFESRLAQAAQALAGNAVAEIVPHIVCRGFDHLETHCAALVADGAEGVMLRAPGSAYEHRRSGSLLKYKPFCTDEAQVIGYESGNGRLAGLTGALVCVWQGVRFALGAGLYDELRTNPPPLGALVTFQFMGLTDGGTPRQPVFLAVRNYE
jgi:DNA ligase-1